MNASALEQPPGDTRPLLRGALAGLLLAALVIAGWHIAWMVGSWRVLIAYPYGTDYGEGIVWQQMLNILAGKGYAPLGTYPAIVYHYPPVYHWITGASVRFFGGDPLATGRAVSIVATLASAALVGLLVTEATDATADRTTRCLCGLASAAMFLASAPIVEWSAVMRVDMVACAFSLGGLWMAVVASRYRAAIHVASLLFVLAVYTKQVAVGAPLAGIGGMMLADRRLALICLLETAVLGSVALGALELATGGGFLRHVVLYNVNRANWSALASLIVPLRLHLIIAALAIMGAFDVAHDRAPKAARTVLLAFLAIKLVMLAMIVKSGANTNYLIEAVAILTVFAGVALAPAIGHIRGGKLAPEPFRAALTAFLILQAAMLPISELTDAGAAQARQPGDRLVSLIREAKGPVISDDMTFLLRAGRAVEWEPAIVAELGHLGRYDEAGFIRMVHAHRFAFFVTEGDRGAATFDARYDRPVLEAIEAAYPRKRNIGGYIVRFPAA